MLSRGRALINDRYHNKGTAFSADERVRYALDGLLPPAVQTLEVQLQRVREEYDDCRNDLERHFYLRGLQEWNSVLYYRFVVEFLEELLPIVYTPTVGLACQRWSDTYRHEHGLYVSWPDRHRAADLLGCVVGDREIDVIVVTDGERVLGLGDLGVGGMGISIGKLALYTAAGGLDPARTLPVVLDAGTDNEALLSNPLYLGWRSQRVRGEGYDELVDAFVAAVLERFPRVLLQWEDFALRDAARLLERHRDRVCSFNDDIQGTAAVTTAAILSGLHATGVPVADLRVVIAGAGSAGTGVAGEAVRALVAAGLAEPEARRRCWLVDRHGLVHDGQDDLTDTQRRFARPWSEVAGWDDDGDGEVSLLRVVSAARPHALVGLTGQPKLFSEAVVRAQAAGVDRPIVLPLSNPTPRAEAEPAEVLAWTEGRALVGTGSPFAPVLLDGVTHHIAQVNNVYVFPGVGLGVVAVGATRVTDGMITAASAAVGEAAPCRSGEPGAALLPPLRESRRIARAVALAVGRRAVAEGLAPPLEDHDVLERVEAAQWEPTYRPLP